MKVVFDTNVLIAAFAARGLCHELFELCLSQHEIVLSEQILTEVDANMRKKLHLPLPIVRELLQYLRDNTFIENVQPPTFIICRDRSDDWILALAEQIKAAYIVTGDYDLLIIGKHATIPIVQPRRLWDILNTNKNG
jgi:putative PIN family toxin of toxin-antitoxin system